jgi:hypothetical protein
VEGRDRRAASLTRRPAQPLMSTAEEISALACDAVGCITWRMARPAARFADLVGDAVSCITGGSWANNCQ